MSRYADKHHSGPLCAVLNCPVPANKLAAPNGVPYWYCAEHYEQFVERSRK